MAKTIESLVVLLVDDEQFIRQLVGRILRDIGVQEVMTAADGEEAAKKLDTYGGRVDMVITDLDMPHKNGFQLVQEIRNKALNVDENIPVIILTGHGQQESVTTAVNIGIHGFVVKPMSRQALEKRMINALNSGPIDPTRLEKA